MSIVAQDAMIGARPHGAVPFLSREQILDATDACFAEAGYDGTTIRAIAAKLGCSVGSIYRYFTDKRDLLLACGRRMMSAVIDAADDGAPFETSLRLYMERAREHAELYRLQFWLTGSGAPPIVEQIIERWGAQIGDPREARNRWALMHGLLMLDGTCETPPPVAEIETAALWPVPELAQALAEDEPEEDMTLL